MRELVGQSLDRYQIVSLLGEGGMGAVFKAHDVTLQRDVAIKVMHPQFAQRPDFQERFLQEARTAARMDHPAIVRVHDFGQARSHLYIVMEFIPGDNLRAMLQDLKAANKWIVLSEAVQLVRQVCLSIDYAHQQGVLHRDIKPDNIMLKPKPSDTLPYRPVLTDLGLAKLLEGGLMTREGVSMGTPAYMSPEQALGQQTDARSDVYSLGILLYEMAVSRLPFPIKTITEAIRYHTKEPPPPPRSLRPDLPEPVERIILRALEKDAADRFPDAAAMAGALADVLPAATEADAAPTTLEEAVSLMTQYQQSLVAPRGASILDEFPTPVSVTQDRISVLSPDGSVRAMPIEAETLTIGRGDDNGLVLDDPKVSRRHARVEFDGTNYQVIDLDSTNGTYLANVKLLPGVPEVWTPDKPLRLGDHWLRLERTQQAATGTIIRADGTAVDPTQIHTSPGTGRVGIFMETTELAVEPGSSTTASLIILNQGPVVDHFQVSVEGVPAEWLPALPPPVQLLPGAQQDVTLTVQPPRSPQSRAGSYPITIRVASQDAPDEVAEVTATLAVGIYHQFGSDLRPEKIRAGDPAEVTVENQGNTRQTFTLTWEDRADELAFSPPEAQLTVSEGVTAAAQFRAAPRRRRWIGGEETHAFSTQVTSPEGEVQTHSGELISKGLIPIWVLPLVLILCMALTAAAAFIRNQVTSEYAAATQTAEAIQQAATATESARAMANQATVQAATLTAEALAGANRATIEAATATASWLDEDDDRDGLTNRRELELGTLPNVLDTDEDGLDDGEELNRGTEPLEPDTDGDGLKDGDEVSRGIDPLSIDTDGDGAPDASDPDPGRAPTPTPSKTTVPTPSRTPTAPPPPTRTPTTPPPTHTSTIPPPTHTPTATPIPFSAAIAGIECGPGLTLYVHIRITNDEGITSYAIWSTWGGGGEIERTFTPPLPREIDEVLTFEHAISDNVDREHQLGLKVTAPDLSEPFFTYAFEPGGRCPGHYQPPAPPVTHSTGLLEIPQTWAVDLDEGVMGTGSDADIWFEAETATQRFVTPRNGATIAIVGTSSVGRDGCAAAPLSTARIHVNNLPTGTYVCVLTNLGRYSQFRVNAPVGPSPGTLEIGYITWE